MKEATRQFYLSALGIDVWKARYPLPGAAPSVRQEAEDGVAAPYPLPPEREEPTLEPGAPQGLDELKSVLEEDVDSPAAEDESDLTSLPVEDQPGRTDSTLSLRAAFWHGNRLSLAADLGENPGSEIQLRLGTQIMAALGEAGVPAEIMQWPAFENRALPGNDDAAFERFVHGVAAASPSSFWLVLGPESMETLLPRFREQGQEIGLLSELTLSRLVSEGSAKRDLWEAIKQSGFHGPPGNGDDR